MSDYNSLYQQGLYLSPDQQDLLLAALTSNNPPQRQQQQQQPQPADRKPKPDPDATPAQASSGSFSMSPGFDRSNLSGGLGYGDDESPFLDFNPETDFDFPDNLIGDLPGTHESGEKRKEFSDNEEEEESGKKRRESQSKKPGRKPLTSEPTSKRKAQNRAAQRAFRERKEKHLKDLEDKVDELQKASDDANQENGLLRAQVERLQVELREYRKRLSWATSGNGLSAMSSNTVPNAQSRGMNGLKNNDFMFDFPKFGDLPNSHIFKNAPLSKSNQNKSKDNGAAARADANVPGVLSRESLNGANNGLPKPSSQAQPANGPAYKSKQQSGSSHDTSNSDSPSSCSDSHQSHLASSSGTSPEPSTNSPAAKNNGHQHSGACTYHTINGEESFCEQLGLACGNIKNPIPAFRSGSESAANTPAQNHKPQNDTHDTNTGTNNDANSGWDQSTGLDSLAQQNGGQFDPVLFGDWREPQDSILSQDFGQDFGSFFDDAFPLPDLGSPSHNYGDVASQQQQPPKKDLISQIDNKLDEDEVVPGEDKSQMLSCTKIWDRLQSMEKFRNGEIDVDNLCSELRTKARCSEGGVVVNQSDVDDIMGRAK